MKAKSKMTKLLLCGTALIAAGGMAARAQTSDSSEIDQLKAQMQEMQKNMDAMQEKINELEQEKATANQNQAPAHTAQPAAPVANYESSNTNVFAGMASPIKDRGALNDQQVPAPRLDNDTLDPKYYGFFQIPNTPAIMQLNAKPRVDAMADTKNTGNPDRFVTATIPTSGGGGGPQFNMTARGSQLSMDVRAPSLPGDFRFYYQNDFFGSGGGSMPYRLRQLYGQFYNVTAGFTYSIFEDPDVWPDTVDYEGPDSAIFARQATVRYMVPLGDGFQMNFGLQQPSSDIDTDNTTATAVNHAPDGGFNIRWENSERGHVQLAMIFRDLGANDTTLGNQNVLGWGMNFSANLDTFGKDTLQAQITYGDGIFHFCNDNFTYTGFAGGDAAFNSAGQLKALAYVAPMLGYTHYWCDDFRSTVSAGYVNLENQSSQTGAAYHQTVYTSANLVWQIRKRLSVGLESLYGYKQDQDQDHRAVWRFQTGLVYSLF
ncbi:MAG TPA: DcaP family trimeric outer membrane transporter [Pseudomonadales bacterium]|nr:DcaP family trimeric outer membrane transporter [Pseudomonadales bacterium]